MAPFLRDVATPCDARNFDSQPPIEGSHLSWYPYGQVGIAPKEGSMTIGCPHCRTESQYGVHVCVGCQAEVVYGATGEEQKQYLGGGAILGAIGEFAFFNTFGVQLDLKYLAIGAVIGGVLGAVALSKVHGSDVRFFRRYQKH